MNVLSLFDGMSCGQIALDRVGIHVDNYFASEVDKYAIKVTQANHPDTIQIGDVRNVKAANLPKIDLLIGGSPCQGFSQAGKGGKFNDPRSKLFWEYVRILKECRERNPEIKFLLENVRMDKYSEGVISDALGLDPVVINSALVSAQNRVRLYWTNIKTEEHTMFGHLRTAIPQPEDRGILLKDILETPGVGAIKNMGEIQERSNKALNIDANYYKGIDNHGQRTLVQVTPDKSKTVRSSGRGSKDRHEWDRVCIQVGEADLKGHDSIKRVYSPAGKGPSLTTMQGGHREPKVGIKQIGDVNGKNQQGYHVIGTDGKCPTLLSQSGGIAGNGNHLVSDPPYTHWRKLTPLECERLQTVPDNYTNHVSNTQRYKMLGNGWTVDVVVYIFSFLSDSWKFDNPSQP